MDEPDKFSAGVQVWLDLLRAGDPQAREELINYSCRRLRQLTDRMMRKFRRLERWEPFDDVFQDAMLRLHLSLRQVQPTSPSEFLGLAATQIRRTLIDLARRHFGSEANGVHPPAEFANSEHLEWFAEPATLRQWAEFYETLDRMPEPERTVVDLLWFENLTQSEAAGVLGVTPRTVRRRWNAARSWLYAALNEGEE